jgi:hypothetical protein
VRSVGREENVDRDAVFGHRGRPARGVPSIAPAQCVRAIVGRERMPASGQLCEGDDWWWWLCDHVFVRLRPNEAIESRIRQTGGATDERWICEECFGDFKTRFRWSAADPQHHGPAAARPSYARRRLVVGGLRLGERSYMAPSKRGPNVRSSS